MPKLDGIYEIGHLTEEEIDELEERIDTEYAIKILKELDEHPENFIPWEEAQKMLFNPKKKFLDPK